MCKKNKRTEDAKDDQPQCPSGSFAKYPSCSNCDALLETGFAEKCAHSSDVPRPNKEKEKNEPKKKKFQSDQLCSRFNGKVGLHLNGPFIATVSVCINGLP